MFNDKTILITGGTGSLGTALTKDLLRRCPNLKEIIIFSRGESKQYAMKSSFAVSKDKLRFVIGDVKDLEKLEATCKGVDYVIHAAASKIIPVAEDNPEETIQSNIVGTSNVITASKKAGIEKVVFISTDKAVNPLNVYGSTKKLGESLIINANKNSSTRFSAVRYGNVLASRGSVVRIFQSQKDILTLTDPEMTRFYLTLSEAVGLIEKAFRLMVGGEIFVPLIRSTTLLDLADVCSPSSEKRIIGARPGEKKHEELINKYEAHRTRFDKDEEVFIILPEIFGVSEHLHLPQMVQENFTSDGPTTERFAPEDLKAAIAQELETEIIE